MVFFYAGGATLSPKYLPRLLYNPPQECRDVVSIREVGPITLRHAGVSGDVLMELFFTNNVAQFFKQLWVMVFKKFNIDN